jgi:FkbM family methyltransferase
MDWYTLARKARVALTPRSALLTTRLSNGALVKGRNRPGWGGRGIYIFRDELEPELAHLEHFVRAGDVFVDVGANVGVFTCKAAMQTGPGGLVVACEPFLESAAQLYRNVALNRFQNVRIRNLCMSDKTGPVQFWMNHAAPNSFSLIREGEADAFNAFCVTLDDLATQEDLKRLDYLKLDAEGAEEMILAGGAASIERFCPIIQVEITINSIYLPPGYTRLSAGGKNHLYIPQGRPEALATALQLGWKHVGINARQVAQA